MNAIEVEIVAEVVELPKIIAPESLAGFLD